MEMFKCVQYWWVLRSKVVNLELAFTSLNLSEIRICLCFQMDYHGVRRTWASYFAIQANLCVIENLNWIHQKVIKIYTQAFSNELILKSSCLEWQRCQCQIHFYTNHNHNAFIFNSLSDMLQNYRLNFQSSNSSSYWMKEINTLAFNTHSQQ
jgi:hypothetical protein